MSVEVEEEGKSSEEEEKEDWTKLRECFVLPSDAQVKELREERKKWRR